MLNFQPGLGSSRPARMRGPPAHPSTRPHACVASPSARARARMGGIVVLSRCLRIGSERALVNSLHNVCVCIAYLNQSHPGSSCHARDPITQRSRPRTSLSMRCSRATPPRGSYEELVTTHHFIGVAPMHLVEQTRALHDYQGAWVYSHLRP